MYSLDGITFKKINENATGKRITFLKHITTKTEKKLIHTGKKDGERNVYKPGECHDEQVKTGKIMPLEIRSGSRKRQDY